MRMLAPVRGNAESPDPDSLPSREPPMPNTETMGVDIGVEDGAAVAISAGAGVGVEACVGVGVAVAAGAAVG